MDDYPLTLTTVAERAERFHAAREIVTRRPDKRVERTTYGAVLSRARCLAGGLRELGIKPGDRVATLLWNQSEHLELYFAVPCMGAVVHTLNPRLHPDELAYHRRACGRPRGRRRRDAAAALGRRSRRRVDRARDRRLAQRACAGGDDRVRVARRRLRADRVARPRRAPACGDVLHVGHDGPPKGVVYSHRAAVLHALAAALPDALGVSRATRSCRSSRCSTRTRGDSRTPRRWPARDRLPRARTSTPRAFWTCSPTSA